MTDFRRAEDETDQLGATQVAPALVSEDAFEWPSEPLAKGGMAVVYLGDDRRLGRKVILKAPREDVEVPEGYEGFLEARLDAESQVLARLQHPSIVTIYEKGKASTGTPFCVLEKVEGRALRDLLLEIDEAETDGRPRTRERLELVSNLVGIAEAIAYAHERGIVHRDVTPNNILIGRRGEATLIDWGLAKDTGAETEALDQAAASLHGDGGGSKTIIAGTPPYVSLEQTQGEPADPSYDVYSFGVTLYEVVSGQTPFRWDAVGDSQREQRLRRWARWLEKGHPSPPAAPDDPELSGIIAKAIAHRREDRFTADELVLALKQYLTGELVFSHRYSLSGRIGRWVRRHRALSATVTLLAMAVVAVVIILLGVRAQNARHARAKAELEAKNAATALANAELSALTAAARLDAAEKQRAAEAAATLAVQAEARAAEARKRGENADALREEAEKQRALAEKAQTDAEDAAKRAEGSASDAEQRWKAAIAERDAATAARAEADAARAKAEDARAKAEQARTTAEEATVAAATARKAAEEARDRAETDRKAAELERDTAQKKIEALEKKIAELEKPKPKPEPQPEPQPEPEPEPQPEPGPVTNP